MNHLRSYLEVELARAEAVASGGEGGHQPTIDMHKGMVIAYQKLLAILDYEDPDIRRRSESNPDVSPQPNWPKPNDCGDGNGSNQGIRESGIGFLDYLFGSRSWWQNIR